METGKNMKHSNILLCNLLFKLMAVSSDSPKICDSTPKTAVFVHAPCDPDASQCPKDAGSQSWIKLELFSLKILEAIACA